MLPLGAVKETVLAARRRGLTRIVLPVGAEKQFAGFDDELRREMTVDCVTRTDELRDPVLAPTATATSR